VAGNALADLYRLVFRGELGEGQHPVVVRKKLGAALHLDDAALDKMFSGRAVVVRKQASEQEAARFQAVFKKAGAILQALALDAPVHEQSQATESGSRAADGQTGEAGDEMNLLPSGADVLSPDERKTETRVDVDTAHLALDPKGTPLANDEAQTDVGELGVDFSLADLGIDLHQASESELLEIPIEDVDFGLAEAGTVLETVPRPEPPPPPDTSHLKLEDDKET
tara:strand:+ start:270 stop:944 length:675 start_codon:yes stop_codon:yes gene_type:complete